MYEKIIISIAILMGVILIAVLLRSVGLIKDKRLELYSQLTRMKTTKTNGDTFSYPKDPDQYYHDK